MTDRTWLGNETLYEQVEKALEGGATLVQLREKELPEADVQKEAEELLELCHRYGVKLILDDDVELAAKVGADGVHIGQSDMELAHAREILTDKIIGVTAKPWNRRKPQKREVLIIWEVVLCLALQPKGCHSDEARAAGRNLPQRENSGCGNRGITAENVLQLKGRGIAGVAVVSGIFACEDIETGTRHLGELVEQII